MADSEIDILDALSNTKGVDTRTTTAGDHRQVTVLGGETDAEIAVLANAPPGASTYGLAIRPVVSMNAGVMDATTQRVVLASDGPTVTVLGATTGAAVVTDANGSIQGYLRGLVKLIAAKIGTTVADGDNATEGLTTDAAVAAGAVGTISAKLRRATQGIEDLKSLIVLAAGGNVIGKVGIDQTTPGGTNLVAVTNAGGYSAPLTITRPANQTPYTGGDVVGGALTFPAMGPSAGRVILTSAQLELDITAIPTGMTSFTLYLYNVTPPSAIADNGAWDLPSGDRASFLGSVALGTPADLGSTLYVETSGINKQLKLAGTSLFGYLVTAAGYTPAANSEVYVATLHAVAL